MIHTHGSANVQRKDSRFTKEFQLWSPLRRATNQTRVDCTSCVTIGFKMSKSLMSDTGSLRHAQTPSGLLVSIKPNISGNTRSQERFPELKTARKLCLFRLRESKLDKHSHLRAQSSGCANCVDAHDYLKYMASTSHQFQKRYNRVTWIFYRRKHNNGTHLDDTHNFWLV